MEKTESNNYQNQQNEIEQLKQKIDEAEQKIVKELKKEQTKKTKDVINKLKKIIQQSQKKIDDLLKGFLEKYNKNISVNDLENMESNEKKTYYESLKDNYTEDNVRSFAAKKLWNKTGTEKAKDQYNWQQSKKSRKNNDTFFKIQQYEDQKCLIPSNCDCFFKVVDFALESKPEMKSFLKEIHENHKKFFKIGISTIVQYQIEEMINKKYEEIYKEKQLLFTQQMFYTRVILKDLNKYKYILIRCKQHVCLIKRNKKYVLQNDFEEQIEYIEKKLEELKIDQSIKQEDIDNLYSKQEMIDCQNHQYNLKKMKKKIEEDLEDQDDQEDQEDFMKQQTKQNEEKENKKFSGDRKQVFFACDLETMQRDENSNQQVYAAAVYTNQVHTDHLFNPKNILFQNLFDKTKEQKKFYQEFTQLMKKQTDIEEKILDLTIQNLKEQAFTQQIKKLIKERKQIINQLENHEKTFPAKSFEEEEFSINNCGLYEKFKYEKNNNYVQECDKQFGENNQQILEQLKKQQSELNSQIYQQNALKYENVVEQFVDDFLMQKMEEECQIIEEETDEENQEEIDDFDYNSQEKRDQYKEEIEKQIEIKFGKKEDYISKIENYEKIDQIIEENYNQINEISKQIQQINFGVFKKIYRLVQQQNPNVVEKQQYRGFFLGQNGIENQRQLVDTFLEYLFSFTRNFQEFNKKSVCYFHNGKGFDFYFFLKNVDLQKYLITQLQRDGENILTFTVSKKKQSKSGKIFSTQIQFKCSTRIIDGSLKNICKDMKLSFRKIEIDQKVLLIKNIDQFQGETEKLIKEYLFFDVLSLAEALTTFRNGLFESSNKIECFNFQTISQISSYTYVEFFQGFGNNLKEMQFVFPCVYQNIWLGEFPIGGRTNCYLNFFIKNCKKYKPFALFYLDMNSLYPSAMKEICLKLGGFPWFNKNVKVLSNYQELVDKFNNYINSENDEDFLYEAFLIECDIYQPLTDDFLFQNYQLFDKNGQKTEKVYKCNFPGECFIKQKFTNVDLFYAVKYNGAKIIKIHQCLFFPDRINLKHDIFMDKLVGQRNKYKKENNDVCQKIEKLKMNGLYGKKIQKPIFEKSHIVQDIEQYKKKNNIFVKDDYIEIGEENKKMFIVKSEVLELFPFSQNIADPVTGAFLLSYSKHLVNQMLVKTKTYKFDEKNIENFCYYSDTDSIIVGQKAYEKLIELGHVGKDLGQIKLEHFIQPGTFESYGKKIYRFQNEFEEMDYRFKGLSFKNISKTQNIPEEEIVDQCFNFMRKNSKKSMSFCFQQFVKDLSKQEICVKINQKVIQSTFQNEKLQQKIENIVFFKNRLQSVQQFDQEKEEENEQ